MPRPRKHRRVCCNPTAYYFKPRGIPVVELQEIILNHDELESLRLADLLAYSHEKAAKEMKISRATFGRIVEAARKKIVDGILNGKAIRINQEELNHKKKEVKYAKRKQTRIYRKNCNSNKRSEKSYRAYRQMLCIYGL